MEESQNERKTIKQQESEQEHKLKGMLLPYIEQALKDNPQCFVSHAADYFSNLRERISVSLEKPTEGSKEFISAVLGSRTERRGTVMAEPYDPEKDDFDAEDIDIVPKTDEERNRILSKCDDVVLFRMLDKLDLTAVIDAMTAIHVEEGDIIIKQGEDGDFFYLIDNGTFNAYIKDKEGNSKLVCSYENKGFFGELALLHNQPRAATIEATSKGLLWAVSRKTFNKLIVKRAFEKRQLYMKLLDGVYELDPLNEYEKMQVADALSGQNFAAGEIIFKEGDEGDGMYFIIEGTVSVQLRKTSDAETRDEEVSQLGPGRFFGGEI